MFQVLVHCESRSTRRFLLTSAYHRNLAHLCLLNCWEKKWNSEIFWKAEVKKTIRLSKIRHNQYISYISCYSEKIPNRSNFRKKEYRNSEFEITVHHINSCLNMFAKLHLQSGNRERAMLGLSILPPLNKVRDARTEVAIFVSALVLLLTHCRKSLEVMQKTLLLQF